MVPSVNVESCRVSDNIIFTTALAPFVQSADTSKFLVSITRTPIFNIFKIVARNAAMLNGR